LWAKLLMAGLPPKNLKRHLPQSPGYINVYRYFFLFRAALDFFSIDPNYNFFLSLFVVGLLLVAPACTLPLNY